MDRRKNDKRRVTYQEGMRPVLRTDRTLVNHYADVLQVFPDAEFVMDGKVLRFRPKGIVNWLLNDVRSGGAGVDLNEMAKAYQLGHFSMDEYMEFYQGIGYSVSGFLDIFHEEVARLVKLKRVVLAGGRPAKRSLTPQELSEKIRKAQKGDGSFRGTNAT